MPGPLFSAAARMRDQTGVGTAGAIRNIRRVENQYQRSQRAMHRSTTMATGGFGKLNASYAGTVGLLGNMGGAGMGAAAGIGILTLAAKRSYDQFVSLNKEVRKSAGIAGGEIRQVSAELTQQAKEISTKWAKPLQQEAWATYQALSGAVTYSGLDPFMDATGRFVRAEFLEQFATGVDLLTTVTNSYGDAARNTGAVVDVLSETIKYGKVTAQQLAETMSTVTPLAAALEIPLTHVTAALAAMTSQGVNAAESTTYIRRFLIELSDTSSDASAEFERITGKTFKAYIAGGRSLSDAAGEIRQDAEAQGRSIDEYFGRVQASQAAMVLSSVAGTKRYQQSFLAISDSFGSAARKAWANMDASYVTVEALGAKFNVAMAGVGQGVGDVIDAMLGWTVQSADMRYASDLTTQALQDEESTVRQLAQAYADLEDAAPSGTRGAGTLTDQALRQIFEDLGIGGQSAGINAYDYAARTSGTFSGGGFWSGGGLPGSEGGSDSGNLLGLLSGGRMQRNRAWEDIEAELGRTFSVEAKRVIEEAAKSARDVLAATARQATFDATRAGFDFEGFEGQVMDAFMRDGIEGAKEILRVGLEDIMRVIMNEGVDLVAEVVRGFVRMGPGSGFPGMGVRTPLTYLKGAAGQFMTDYNQSAYRNQPSVQAAMGGGIGGLEAFGGYEAAKAAERRAHNIGGTWYERPEAAEQSRAVSEVVSELDRFRESIIETDAEQRSLAENLPSYEAALGSMSGEAESVARRAAELGLKFDDLTQAERDAIVEIDRRADADEAAADATQRLKDAAAAAAAELSKLRGVSSGYKFSASGAVTGRLSQSEQILNIIGKDHEKYGGAAYDVARLEAKLAAGRHKPGQAFKTGEFAGKTLDQALALSRARSTYSYVVREEEAQRAEQRRRDAAAAAAAAKRKAEEDARKAEAARVRADRIMGIRYERGDITADQRLSQLRNQQSAAASKYGKFSPEEHAIFTEIQRILTQIEENTADLDRFIEDLLGQSVTSATAPFDRSFQTRLGTEHVSHEMLRELRATLHG